MAPLPHHHPGMAPPRQFEMSSAEGLVMHPEQGMIAHHQPPQNVNESKLNLTTELQIGVPGYRRGLPLPSL